MRMIILRRNIRIKECILLIVIIFCVALRNKAISCGNIPDTSIDWESLMKHEERYVNCNYGYSLTIPNGLVGRSSPPPAPQHGFGIVLSQDSQGYLWIDGSYNSLEWTSLDEMADEYIKWIKEDTQKIISIEKSSITLGGIPAIRLITRYTCQDAMFVEDDILSIDKNGGIAYTIGLSSSDNHYTEYKKILEDIVMTWTFIDASCQ